MPGDIVQLTPDQEAEYNKSSAASAPLNPIRDLNANQLAELAVKDKDNFDLVGEFRRNQDLWKDPSVIEKVADAHNQVKQRGFKLADVPGPKKIAGQVLDVAKGFGKQAWNYAQMVATPVAGAIGDITGLVDTGTIDEANKLAQRGIAENLAGTESALFGLAGMGKRAGTKIGRAVGLAKSPKDFSPMEKVKDLWDAVGTGEAQEQISKGKGAAMTAVGGNVVKELEEGGTPVRPEEVNKLAAGDPFSFYAFGKGLQAGEALVPTAVKNAAGVVGNVVAQKAGQAAATIAGRAIQAGGNLAELGSKAVGKVAPVAGPVIGAAEGLANFGPKGVLPGIYVGAKAGKVVAKGAESVGEAAGKVAGIGEQMAGAAPMVSPVSQLGKDLLESAPAAAGSIAKGAGMDLGVAALSSETPQETQGIGLGAAFGALGAAKGVLGKTVSGQLIAPRDYGVSTPLPSSGKFPTLDTVHADAFKLASPGEQARVNAVRQFVEGAAPGTDVFLAKDPASFKDAFIKAGGSAEQAANLSQGAGFFKSDLPGTDGQPRKVVVLFDPDAAPHESFHAFQDVIGEAANRELDKIVKQEYSGQWDNEGQRYASRLVGGDLGNRTWGEAVLDESGWGRMEATEKIYRNIANEVRAQSGADPDPAFVKQRVQAELDQMDQAAAARHPDQSPDAIKRQVWRDILSPEEARDVSDRYLSRELAAENFDAVFKHLGPSLQEGTGLTGKIARTIANVVGALGGEPLAGRKSANLGVPLKQGVVEAVTKSAKGQLPTIEPAVTKPGERVRPQVAPAEPVTPKQAGEEAKQIAAEAPDVPMAGGTKSPRELLGNIAEAIAQQAGVKINYLSAPGEPAAATTSNRGARREIIEAHRVMPAAARALWEKNFFPEKVFKTSKGGYQIQGWAPEVFASNAHKMAKTLSEISAKNPEVLKLSPYELDPQTKSFTEAGWKQLYEDTQKFVQNQMAGATGAGNPLVVPKSVTERGGYAPPIKPGQAAPLEQARADFINTLFNFKLPETPRMQGGKMPLNVMGQDVSIATEGSPRRLSVPVRPRGVYEGPKAAELGIEGHKILEVNPVRQAIEKASGDAGVPMPSMIEVMQRLNLENIKEVAVTPEQPQFRGNTLTLTAGFLPKTKAGQELEKKGFSLERTTEPSGEEKISITKGDNKVGSIYAKLTDPTTAEITGVGVQPNFRGKGLSEVLYRELGQLLKERGVTSVRGDIVSPKAAAARAKVFPQTELKTGAHTFESPEEVKKYFEEGGLVVETTSKISPTSQFLPKRFADRPVSESARDIIDMPQEEWQSDVRHYKGKFGGGITGFAFDLGATAKTPEDAQALRETALAQKSITDGIIKAGDFDKAMQATMRGQAAREAYEVATGQTLDGKEANSVNFIKRHFDPTFEAPVKSMEPAK